ncbi:hypothetical protein TNCV_4131701 [Trichonephila clavipes]|nr:hypothetical protein TNCV_4131701 [Trichonephila clavipes]
MDVCKCVVPLRHEGTLDSSRATIPLVREGQDYGNAIADKWSYSQTLDRFHCCYVQSSSPDSTSCKGVGSC